MKYSDETIVEVARAICRYNLKMTFTANSAEWIESRVNVEWVMHTQAAEEILAALESTDEHKAERADAERWRYWLREHGWSGYFDDGLTNSESDADIIAAIDKAREASGGGFSPSALRDAQLAHADKARES